MGPPGLAQSEQYRGRYRLRLKPPSRRAGFFFSNMTPPLPQLPRKGPCPMSTFAPTVPPHLPPSPYLRLQAQIESAPAPCHPMLFALACTDEKLTLDRPRITLTRGTSVVVLARVVHSASYR